MFKKNKFPFFKQLDYRDCGPTCLRMTAKFYGKNFSREFLRDKAGITRLGVTMAGIADAAEDINSLARNCWADWNCKLLGTGNTNYCKKACN